MFNYDLFFAELLFQIADSLDKAVRVIRNERRNILCGFPVKRSGDQDMDNATDLSAAEYVFR